MTPLREYAHLEYVMVHLVQAGVFFYRCWRSFCMLCYSLGI